MSKKQKYILAIAYAGTVLFFTAFAIGYSRYCYEQGVKDGIKYGIEISAFSKHIK